MAYQLGILDQSPLFEGKTAAQALGSTVELAQKAEQWGYRRFWVSEHHDSELVAGSSPEILISHLLGKTEKIRIGSGGVMLQHYSPYKVAENFNVLASLAPGRVDVGIGKAPGGLPLSTKALNYGSGNQEITFEDRLVLLDGLLEGVLEEGHPLAGVQATPIPPEKTENFLLGASPGSAKLAASLGWNFVYALFINGNTDVLEKSAAAYQDNNDRGRFLVAAAVVAAETNEEASRLAGDKKLYKVQLESGRVVTLATAESAEDFGRQAGEPYSITVQKVNVLKGTPSEIHEQFDKFHKQLKVDEFIIHTPIEQEKARMRSFELLSPISAKIKEEENIYVY